MLPVSVDCPFGFLRRLGNVCLIFLLIIKRSGYKLTRPFIKYGHCGSINHTISDLGRDRYVFDK